MTQYAWWFCGGVFALCVVMGVGSALTSRGYRFQSGTVQGVIGKMGSGKSLFIVQRVVLPCAREMSKNRGLYCSHTFRPVTRIVTNFEMELPYEGVELITLDGSRIWDHLVELAVELGEPGKPRLDALVVIDEAHLFVPSAKLKVAQKASWVMSMARKLNAEVWWITQSEMKIHKRLRDDTQLIWKVGRSASLWTLLAGPSKWFVAKAFEPERLNRMNATYTDRRFYRLSKAALKAYNSFELIIPDAEADVSLDSTSRGSNVLEMLPAKNADGAGPSLIFPDQSDPTNNDDDRTSSLG